MLRGIQSMNAIEEYLIPISRLFYDDEGPHIIATAAKYTPARGRELHDLLGTSIAQLGGVSRATRRTPVPSPPVLIDTLLYRGRAALDRALEIRATARQTGQAPTAETIGELLDLIGLAAEE